MLVFLQPVGPAGDHQPCCLQLVHPLNGGHLPLTVVHTYIVCILLPAGTIPAAQLAVDRINNDSSILPNYYLQLQTGLDSMVGILCSW